MPYVTLKNGNRIEARDEFTGEAKSLEFDAENRQLLADFGDGSAPTSIAGLSAEQAAELDQAVTDIAQLKTDVARAERKADAAGEVANNKLDNSVMSHTEGMVPVADENGQLVDNYITNANIADNAAIESSKLAFTSAQSSALASGIDATKVAQIQTNTDNISLVDTKATHADDEATRINGLIPSEATTANKLADKAFVNSSIATSTATFRGTFNSLAELEAYSGEKDDNDYAFVAETTGSATVYKRYKFDGSAWVFEYELNNSSFTAAQWATINSGATAGTVAQVETNRTDVVALQNSVATKVDSADLAAAEATALANTNTVINAINARKFVYCSGQIVDTATEGTYAWASNTDSDTSGTYPYVYTSTFGVVGGLPYDANDKFAMIINFPPAQAVSGNYAPFCTFTTRNNNGGQTWFDYKIYAKAIPSHGFAIDVVVMGQYPAIGTISNS